jgi:hypothetical protein
VHLHHIHVHLHTCTREFTYTYTYTYTYTQDEQEHHHQQRNKTPNFAESVEQFVVELGPHSARGFTRDYDLERASRRTVGSLERPEVALHTQEKKRRQHTKKSHSRKIEHEQLKTNSKARGR